MSGTAGGTGFYRILVAVETDATQYYGPDAKRPAVLGSGDAESLLSHIAADLKALLPEAMGCSLITAGALFDQTQVLRPEFPVFRALESVPSRRGETEFKPRLVSIGAEQGAMPVGDLQPLEEIPLGLLQLLPVVLHGPAERVTELGQAMEYRFLEEGQLSPHTATWMQTAFGIRINHARFMTLIDLNAMLRLQLDHFGFLPLWEILDTALTGHEDSLRVTSDSGMEFEWKDGAVHTEFQTFDHWATRGSGAQKIAARQALAEAYGDWTRELRQYLTTLKAHGVELQFHLPGTDEPLTGTFMVEQSDSEPGSGDSTITEHSYSELGTVAITVLRGGQVENYYPLTAQGLNDIHTHLRKHVPGQHTVAFPGTILYDSKTRRLVPDTDPMKGSG